MRQLEMFEVDYRAKGSDPTAADKEIAYLRGCLGRAESDVLRLAGKVYKQNEALNGSLAGSMLIAAVTFVIGLGIGSYFI